MKFTLKGQIDMDADRLPMSPRVPQSPPGSGPSSPSSSSRSKKGGRGKPGGSGPPSGPESLLGDGVSSTGSSGERDPYRIEKKTKRV